jgi:hypothetical protein
MPSPTVRSRRLAAILRHYRLRTDLLQRDVARHVNRTVQWVCRVENAATCRPSVGDVRSLLALYQVTDPAEVERVATLAAEVKQNGWWHEYDLSAAHATFVGLEAEASQKRVWEPLLIPGLLQIPDYARAIITAGPDDLPPGRVEELVRVRAERQKLLVRPVPLVLHAITDEAALRRQVGSPALMRAQMAHIAEVAQAPNVTVQVLPFSAGAHQGMTGAFTILGYPDPDDHDIVYCDTPAGPVYTEDDDDIGRAHRAFANLSAASLSAGDSMDLIAKAAVGL